MEMYDALSGLIDSAQRVMAAIDNDNRVMTCSEAAFILKKDQNTISRYIAAGKLHKVSGNGIIGVPAREVYKLIWK